MTRGGTSGACAVAALLLAASPLALACGRPTAAPADAPLRVATYSDPLSFDPHFFNEFLTFSTLGNLYESLVEFDAQLRVQPALAASWENPNDHTWRFHLRDGVRFHDGSTLGAADVVASLQRVRSHSRSAFGNYLVMVEEVRALDGRTVEITTAQPFPLLLNKLCFIRILPAAAPAEVTHPVGTGPYLLDAHEPGKRLALRAFSRYWRGRAPEERVELLVVPDPGERVAALLSGRADLVQDIEAKAIDRIRAAGAYRVLGSESLLVEYLQFRLDAPPFSDLRVRRAVHLAIDREALVQQQLRGQGVAVGQMVGRQVFGYAPGISPPRRDLETARRLLAEAGYAGGFDVDLEFRASRDPGSLVEQLGEAGIRVRTVARPWEEMYRRLTGNQVDFYLGGLLAISADASDLFDSKVHSRDSARGYGDTNHTGYANAALDALIESSGATLNMLERRQLMQRSMQLLMEDLPLVPLYVPFDLYAVRDGVEWTPRLDGLVLAREMRRREGRWR